MAHTRAAERQRRRSGERVSPRGRTSRGRSRAPFAIAGLIAVGVVAALVWLGNTYAEPAPAPDGVRASANVRGVETAPVTIEEWADFQCPACRQFALGAERELVATFVAQGKVRLVFRSFAFLGQESIWAAEASQCASEEGRFWDLHDRLYAAQAGENRGTFSKANLKQLGALIGLGSSFAACVDSGRYAQLVHDETAAGKTKGVTATPTLFVNGRKLQGAVPIEQLRTIIEPLLAPQ